jgi:hypothetical protein
MESLKLSKWKPAIKRAVLILAASGLMVIVYYLIMFFSQPADLETLEYGEEEINDEIWRPGEPEKEEVQIPKEQQIKERVEELQTGLRLKITYFPITIGTDLYSDYEYSVTQKMTSYFKWKEIQEGNMIRVMFCRLEEKDGLFLKHYPYHDIYFMKDDMSEWSLAAGKISLVQLREISAVPIISASELSNSLNSPLYGKAVVLLMSDDLLYSFNEGEYLSTGRERALDGKVAIIALINMQDIENSCRSTTLIHLFPHERSISPNRRIKWITTTSA